MIDELYDSVLSIANQTGYLDITEQKDSLLRWSGNRDLPHIPKINMANPPYPVKVFSHDFLINSPYSYIIDEFGVVNLE
jgi:hypothetical protein